MIPRRDSKWMAIVPKEGEAEKSWSQRWEEAEAAAEAEYNNRFSEWKVTCARIQASETLRCISIDVNMINSRLPLLFSIQRLDPPPRLEAASSDAGAEDVVENAKRECERVAQYFRMLLPLLRDTAVKRNEIPCQWPAELVPPSRPIQDATSTVEFLSAVLEHWEEQTKHPDVIDFLSQDLAEEVWHTWDEATNTVREELEAEMQLQLELIASIANMWGATITIDPDQSVAAAAYSVYYTLSQQLTDSLFEEYRTGSDGDRARIMGDTEPSPRNPPGRPKTKEKKLTEMTQYLDDQAGTLVHKQVLAAAFGLENAESIDKHYAKGFPSRIQKVGPNHYVSTKTGD